MTGKRPLFSVTAEDCEWQSMTAGGPGGQHQNRSQTAIRVKHPPSGAVGESREFKSQIQNKRAAFKRMGQTQLFRQWVRVEAGKRQGAKSLDELVEDDMRPENLRVEVKDEEGRWVLETTMEAR